MHIISTVNPQTRSPQDLPVIVLSCANRQKFVQRPRTYAELVTLAEEKYHLKDQSSDTPTRLIFTTSTLDICQGKDIEIDESAYSVLGPVLDEVKVKRVKVSEHAASLASTVTLAEATREPLTPPLDSEGRAEAENTPTPSTIPASSSRAVEKTPSIVNHIHSVLGSTHDYPPSSSRSTRPRTARIEAMEDDVTSMTGAARTPFRDTAQPQAAMMARTRGRSASPEKAVPATPTSRRGAGRKVNVQPQPTPVQFEDEEEEVVEIPPVQSQELVVQKDHGRSHAKKNVKLESEASGSGGGTPRHHLRTPHAHSRTPAKPNSSAPDERFTAYIVGPGVEAEFKTRGKHTVKKVIAGACRNWGLDYERARLILIAEEDGEETRFICEPELTMAECGVTATSRLEIELDDEEEQDESELEDEDDVKDDLLDFD